VAPIPEVLRERDYQRLFAAQATSLLGDEMVSVALAFGVLAAGGSASDIGIVLAARALALVACLLGGGVIGDRVARRTVLVVTDVVRLVSQAAVAAALIGHFGGVALLAALSAVTGAAGGVFNPTATGYLPAVVAPERLQEANSLRTLATSAGRIAGPLIAGLLVATAGAGWAIAVDAATYAVSAVLVLGIAVDGRPAPDAPPPESFLADLRGGWSAFIGRTWLWTVVVTFGLGNIAFGAWRVLGPVVAENDLGGAGAWSAIIAASGVGGLLASVVSMRIAPSRPLIWTSLGFMVFFGPVALLAIPATTVVVAASAFVAEAALVIGLTVWESTLQRHIEPHLLARVSSYDWLGSLALFPLGLALWGPIADLTGTSDALWIAAAMGILVSLPPLALREVRTLPAAPERATTGA
jgi:MFS family permease